MTKHLANILTGFRIFGSILLLFLPAFSPGFMVTYLLCGLSDMADGPIARKTNTAGSFGSRLDTAADLVFAAVALWKLLPSVHLPVWLWRWGGGIAAIKLSGILWKYLAQKQFLALHTTLNKAAGLLLFLWPLTIPFAKSNLWAILVCAVATPAAIQEGLYTLTNRKP